MGHFYPHLTFQKGSKLSQSGFHDIQNRLNNSLKWAIMNIYADIFFDPHLHIFTGATYISNFTKFHQNLDNFFNLKVLIFLITFLDPLGNGQQKFSYSFLIIFNISYKNPNLVDSTSKKINIFSIFIITFFYA